MWALCGVFSEMLGQFPAFHQVSHCAQRHIRVLSLPTCCIMDEAKETKAAGVLAIKRKEERTELLIVGNRVHRPSFLLQTAALCVHQGPNSN